MVSSSNTFVAEARSAAFWLVRLIPPEPRKSNTPERMKIIPSKNTMSVDER